MRRPGRASPGHRLSLRGKVSGSSASAPRADCAMRGLAISSLIPLRMAFAASLSKVLLVMIDDCTLLYWRMVNPAHAPMLLGDQTHEFGAALNGSGQLWTIPTSSAEDQPCGPSTAHRLCDLHRNTSECSRTRNNPSEGESPFVEAAMKRPPVYKRELFRYSRN